MSTDEVPGWLAVHGFRVVMSLLLAVLGWYITSTLAEIKGNIRETNQGVQVLMQNKESTSARLEMIEQLAQRNAERLREVERQVWQTQSQK